MTASTGSVRGLFVVLDGHLSIRVDRGAGPRIVMEWHGGDVTGVLPYSRIKSPPGSVIAETRTTVLLVYSAEIPRLIHECPELTAVLVHVMLDRARVFKSSELLDEKMVSLGRLAAGLAHELNNPASAVERSAKTLAAELARVERATRGICSLSLSESQWRAIDQIRDARSATRSALAPLERADLQDAIEGWLAGRGINDVNVETFVETGFTTADFETLGTLVGADKLRTVLEYLAAELTVRELTSEIDTAATRIHQLVAAVKGFTYVNQQATLQPIAIGKALSDTITVLRSKAKTKSVDVALQVPSDLPAVEGYGGELNQVWANLLDNAIDAAPGGHVRVDATAADGQVVVSVKDDGPGIPPEIQKRIFDPFFTTKDIGQGTGLGLDIARRIVLRHKGVIDLNTSPKGTEFRVTLPACGSPK
jgi:signal transduction histidine kinase